MSRGRGRRHLIVLDDGSCPAPDASVLREIVGAARGTEITIHAVSPRQAPWRDICADTGGQWLVGTNEDSAPELLTGLCAYLTASYQVRYRSNEVADLRIEVCTGQGLGEVTQLAY